MSGVASVRYRHTKVNYELCDLEAGDPLLPPNADTTSRLEVVPIHDNMYHQVNGDGNPRLQVLSLARRIKSFRRIMYSLQMCFRRVGCNTKRRLLHDGSNARRLQDIRIRIIDEMGNRDHTEGLLLDNKEHGVQELDIFDKIVQL